MPRVVNPPRPAARSVVATPRKASQTMIPLNDDKQEKAQRLQSRQALHDIQMNQLKAAASPVKKQVDYNSSPRTPRGHNKENDSDIGVVGSSHAVTPMKRVPILANFEEWMKMATDNKINAANSWNFALIDYFHDMSLLKEGDGVNFQKASCTLDGCVKIYTSRVDSVATETGKLLSGLADTGNKNKKDDDAADGEEDDEDEDGEKKKTGKKAQRSSEATLVPSFASLQLKKLELEFSVDPLFKKMSADFDEGGAKGLLLNHLSIDSRGRILFDSNDENDAQLEQIAEEPAEDDRAEAGDLDQMDIDQDASQMDPEGDRTIQETSQDTSVTIDVAALGLKFFPDLSRLDSQDICPSLKNFDLGDPSGSLNIPFLQAPNDWRQEMEQDNLANQSGMVLEGDDLPGFEGADEDDGIQGGFDIPLEAGFGEGGEAWAKEAALEMQTMPASDDMGNDDLSGEGEVGVGGFEAAGNEYGVILQSREGNHDDILSYFDQALKKNWAGPEHWRIRKIKDINKPAATPRQRKDKEPFLIDFASPLDPLLAEAIYTKAASSSAISMPKVQWKTKSRNLLPDDKHFNSRQLLRLFLKPKARIGSKQAGHGTKASSRKIVEINEPEGEMDEAFWAKNDQIVEDEAVHGAYDANFFQDDGLPFAAGPGEDDDDDFADARDHFSPAPEDGDRAGLSIDGVLNDKTDNAFGAQLVTQGRRLRPEYVQYARVAKKVDVRKLKEEMWKGIGFTEASNVSERTKEQPNNQRPEDAPLSPTPQPQIKEDQELKFTDVMSGLQEVYPKQAMSEISTSYCFICLLHLANEKGLIIQNDGGLEELSIKRDHTADLTAEA